MLAIGGGQDDDNDGSERGHRRTAAAKSGSGMARQPGSLEVAVAQQYGYSRMLLNYQQKCIPR